MEKSPERKNASSKCSEIPVKGRWKTGSRFLYNSFEFFWFTFSLLEVYRWKRNTALGERLR